MKSYPQERIVKVNFGFYPNTITQIEYLAQKHGRSISNCLRFLVEQEYKKEKVKGAKTAQ